MLCGHLVYGAKQLIEKNKTKFKGEARLLQVIYQEVEYCCAQYSRLNINFTKSVVDSSRHSLLNSPEQW